MDKLLAWLEKEEAAVDMTIEPLNEELSDISHLCRKHNAHPLRRFSWLFL